ncbi:hypothetical protein ACOME3_004838 [Neoechinorhynchus agilis]
MSFSPEKLPNGVIFDALSDLHPKICSAIGICDCNLTPISYKELTASSLPVIVFVKAIVAKDDCCNHECVCIIKIRVNLTSPGQQYTLLSIKCNVKLDEEIIPF